MTNKRPPTETRIKRDVERVLLEQLPASWNVRSTAGSDNKLDLILEIGSHPDRMTALGIDIKRSIEPRSIPEAATRIEGLVKSSLPDATPVIAAGYLSPRSRQVLEDCGLSYIDTTGNIRIDAGTLFVQTQGVDKDPWPQQNNLQTLRGRGAARALRAIIDTAPPFGLRQLASDSANSPATLSRVLELLEIDGLITREPRGPVQSVNWQDTIRRWAQDYDQTTSNTTNFYLSPRGIPFVEKSLQSANIPYAATGAFAAQRFNPIAPARTATIYVDDVVAAADHLGLRETDAGSNVLLLEPFDPVVFERTTEREGLTCVAPSQLAVDLLTGPGREPSQGEEILEWMKENLNAWHT